MAAANEQRHSEEHIQPVQTCFVDRASSLCMVVLSDVVTSSASGCFVPVAVTKSDSSQTAESQPPSPR
jgi:hypothetical protein